MSVCFITTGPIEWASSRYRAFWIAQHLQDASVIEAANLMNGYPDADTYVFQKAINLQLAETLKEQGKRVIYDICDPMHWFSPNETYSMIQNSDVVTASNLGLKRDFEAWSNRDVKLIPDRLDLSHYNTRKEHKDGYDPIRFIWFGSAQNRYSVLPGFILMERLMANGHRVELTIMDDRPGMKMEYALSGPTYYIRWSLKNEVNVIASHDIALLPPYPGEWGQVKSNNKHLTAWACGLPVVDSHKYEDVLPLVESAERRQQEADAGYELLLRDYTIEKSVTEWEGLL